MSLSRLSNRRDCIDGDIGIGIEPAVGKPLSSDKTALMYAAISEHAEIMKMLIRHAGWTDLICSAILGDVAEVRRHLDECRKRGVGGETALMWAAACGCTEVVRVLVEYEGKMEDNQSHNALYHALKSGHMEVAKVILPHEDPTDENGVTALMRAAARGNAEMAELLISLQKGMKDKDGNAAFMHALKNKHTDIALLLREFEAPSWTPLMCAAFTGDVRLAKKYFFDTDKRNSDGDTALMIAARAGRVEIVELLDPTDKDGVTTLMRAVDRNDVEAVRALIPLQRGRRAPGAVKINGRYICKGTALMRAAAHGYAEIVELLLEHEGGARTSGWPALMFAAQCDRPNHRLADPFVDHPKCVELLVESEGSISGWTELMYAAYRGDVNVVQNSLHMQRSRDVGGWTALMRAAAQGHEQVVELLGNESGMKNNDGQTALMWAARNGHAGCVRLLLEKEGCMQTAKGWTALMDAAYSNNVECARFLAEREKDVKTTHGCHNYPPGTIAFDVARKKGHEEVVSILSD
ncbi:Ankyrin repeat protein [Giardia duodenalis]|uniref:Ankyrin repeat protein n=1 Tax=Giardia intestinalis TaxID=5741 RepID=V6TUM7_GIAIN|nr:Ankyrin repeat protein [Giardia intestinalis]